MSTQALRMVVAGSEEIQEIGGLTHTLLGILDLLDEREPPVSQFMADAAATLTAQVPTCSCGNPVAANRVRCGECQAAWDKAFAAAPPQVRATWPECFWEEMGPRCVDFADAMLAARLAGMERKL